jgi:hypothetical protein
MRKKNVKSMQTKTESRRNIFDSFARRQSGSAPRRPGPEEIVAADGSERVEGFAADMESGILF